MGLAFRIENPLDGWPIAGSGWDLPALNVYAETEILAESNLTGFSYTYGERIVPQLESICNRLRHYPSSRRAITTTWRPEVDSISQHPPCLIVLDFLIRGGALHGTFFFRSWDVGQAAPANMFGLGQLMKRIADEVGADVGEMTMCSTSAHLYRG